MKKIILFMILFFTLIFIPIGAGATIVLWDVFGSHDETFSKQKILEILSKETVLYYSDGQTQLGSIFGQEHRFYVPIEQVSQEMKDAIVSAEDQGFYENIGIDPKGILRAVIHNLLNKSRQGASTITQQTVKNLFGRKKTDIFTKFKEMIDSFKLEKNFTKDQILEFYLNQFHVTSNGRGIGVAAKYYFNKNVEDLNLVECAFIAGSVKGPEKYNPFTKSTLATQENAKQQAFIRKKYVLEKMLEQKKISKEQFEIAAAEPVPFNQGKFQFNEVAVNQIIQKQLLRPDITSALGANTLEEISSLGLRITTTLDKEIQRTAQYGLRKNLSRTEMILSDFSSEAQNSFVSIQKPELYNFYTARIDSVTDDKIVVSLGIPSCEIDQDSITETALATDQAIMSGAKKAKVKLMKLIHVNDYVMVSIKKIDDNGNYFCDLEQRPKVQGAALVLDKGQIVAMSGGFATNEYNRAVFAERQPGSTFKIPTYYAALQLGWSVLDPLSNLRDVFTWQGKYYYPRSDHPLTTTETTLIGAGAHSENLASVWLLRHLLDKLSYPDYLNLLNFLEITKPNAPMHETLQLIMKKFNASPEDIFAIKDGLLEKIKSDQMADLDLTNDNRLKVLIRTLHIGKGFEDEEQIINTTFTDEENAAEIKKDAETLLKEKHEKEFRLNSLRNNLIRWKNLSGQAKASRALLEQISTENGPHKINENDRKLLSSFAYIKNNDEKTIVYISEAPWLPEVASHLLEPIKISPISINDVLSLSKEDLSLFSQNDILLDGIVPMSLIDSISEKVEKEYADLEKDDPLEKLFWNADFRYTLGMYYSAKLVSNMVSQKNIQWIPSFPLGSNPVTLADLAVMYQTFLTGKTYKYFNNNIPNQLVIIKRIEDQSGNLLWEAEPQEFQYVDPFYTTPILNILRGVVTAGTGYSLNWTTTLRSNNPKLDKKLFASRIRVPVFGKTGTTNNYTNGTYVGFLPYPDLSGQNLSPENAYTIATYIGYDSNKPMMRNRYRVFGGGAIPAWQKIAQTIIKYQNYAEKIDWESLAREKKHLVPFNYGENAQEALVGINSGLPNTNNDSNNDKDSINTQESNRYANDYSDNGQTFIKLYLEGDVSDGLFMPVRKVSFFNNNIPQTIKSDE